MTVSIKHCNAKCRKLCNRARVSGSDLDVTRYKDYRNALNRVKKF